MFNKLIDIFVFLMFTFLFYGMIGFVSGLRKAWKKSFPAGRELDEKKG